MRAFKEDDGILDILAKIATILAVAVAAYQYFHYVYPVWEKQNKLDEATRKLEHRERQLAAANREIDNKKELVANLDMQYKRAKAREDEVKKKLLEAQRTADLAIKKQREDLELLESRVRKASNTISGKNQKMVLLYLDMFTKDVFNIQLESIRYSESNDKLNLKTDIINYVNNKKTIDKIEIAALAIFKLYAEKSIKPNEKDYSEYDGKLFCAI